VSDSRGVPAAFPADLHYLVEHQVWARLDGDGLATVGITSLGIRQAGEIYMCRPKSVGSEVLQGRSVGVVELAKSVVSVKSPLSGLVVEVNPLLEEQPEWVHRDPYGRGWLARLRPMALDAELQALLHGEGVAEAMAHHAWLNRMDET
jgi:glycine cleavage system H protein